MQNKLKGKIFNVQEVQAIIAGSKVMFREVIKPQPNNHDGRTALGLGVEDNGQLLWQNGDSGWYEDYDNVKCPYQVGQKIFCKESFSMVRSAEWYSSHDVWYWANGNPAFGDWEKPKPAQHMKQEHSRLFPMIKSIGVERLQDISEEDCLSEGCYFAEGFFGNFNKSIRKIFNFSKESLLKHEGLYDYKLAFKDNWNATHKKPEEKWEANPFVWKVEIEVVEND